MPAIDPALLDRTAALIRTRPASRRERRRPARVRVDSHLSAGAARRSLTRDVLEGLTRPFKELPPKHFYDERGSRLFERICELPEYYPARLERAILAERAPAIAAATGARELLELGCGSASKTTLLLDALGDLDRYLPVDVCAEVVHEASERFASDYPTLAVHGMVGDFERHLGRVPAPAAPRLVAFLGSTLGNLRPAQRRRFLHSVAGLLGDEGRLLVGVDLVKDERTMVRAYDDAAGVTAQFNRNVLRVVNRELGGDFRPEAFEHVALWNPRQEWIEMRLRARGRQRVTIERLGLVVDFAAGEEMRTEISAKFTRARIAADLAAAGLELEAWHTDPDGWYALAVARR